MDLVLLDFSWPGPVGLFLQYIMSGWALLHADGVKGSKSALIAVEEGGTLQSTAALPSGSRSLSAGAAAGIAVGVVAGVAILAWLSTCLILRSRRAR